MAHPLSGADLATLVRAFRDGGRPDHWGRAAGIWASALCRAPISALEHLLVTRRLTREPRIEPPIFIIGHWRSGTTHLYNTMSLGGFGYAGPLAVGLPWDMFGIARALRPLLERALPAHRWIDRMPVTPTSPQEDEIALASMSELSFYHGLYFPRAFDRLIDRGLFLDGASAGQIARWEGRLRLFYDKLALQQGRRLLIKNPVYTARIAQLRRIFPGAKFIHLHRNPFEVFASMRNFHARLLEAMALQNAPEGLDIDATILRVFDRMMRVYETESAELGPTELVEISHADLDTDPLSALRRIHDGLELEGFDAAKGDFERYIASQRSYRRNRFPPDPRAEELVASRWKRWIDKWGYEEPGADG